MSRRRKNSSVNLAREDLASVVNGERMAGGSQPGDINGAMVSLAVHAYDLGACADVLSRTPDLA